MELQVSLVGRTDLSGEIYRQVRRAILEGRLAPGQALPPSRELARRLSVARTTVVAAYERLTSEGFVNSRVGAGTFVDSRAVRPSRTRQAPGKGVLQAQRVWTGIALPTAFDQAARYDFRTGLPDFSLFPHERWGRLMSSAMRSSAVTSGSYSQPAGLLELREAIGRHISLARGVAATADDVVVTNGTQQALDIVARVLLAPGDRIAVEDPGYEPPRLLFRSLGLDVVGVPVDDEGLIVDAVPRRTRAVYVTPSHQYPLGMPMTLSRRLALLAWAERQGAAIIEDDYDSEFRFYGRPIEPLHALDNAGRVMYVGSFSKTLLPALRIGFIVAPSALRDALRRAKYVSDWHTHLLGQAALARFIEDGWYARHLRRARTVYGERHRIVVHAVTNDFRRHLALIRSDAGLHVAGLARKLTVAQMLEVARRASQAGVAFQPLSRFAAGRSARAGLVLGYGAIAAPQIKEGLGILQRCFSAMR